jgi:hypothetical protein
MASLRRASFAEVLHCLADFGVERLKLSHHVQERSAIRRCGVCLSSNGDTSAILNDRSNDNARMSGVCSLSPTNQSFRILYLYALVLIISTVIVCSGQGFVVLPLTVNVGGWDRMTSSSGVAVFDCRLT